MYSLVRFAHVVFLALLLAAGAGVFLRSLTAGGNGIPLVKRTFYHTILWGVIGLFGVLASAQWNRQLSAGTNVSRMIALFDTRSWIGEKTIPKGTIFDRSAIRERAFAVSVPGINGRYVRDYPGGESSGHLIGYSNRERGRAGLEAVFLRVLTGRSVGYAGDIRDYLSNRFTRLEPEGRDVFLTIDSRLQKMGYEALNGRKGAVVILDPESGEVIALVSSPGYSPRAAASDKLWKTLAEREHDAPFFNRALQGLYPPGSVMKLIFAAAALESGTRRKYFSGPEGFTPRLAAKTVHENEYTLYAQRNKHWIGHGWLSLSNALKISSNVYFAQLSLALDGKVVSQFVDRFSFNNSIPWNSASRELNESFRITPSEFPDWPRLSQEQMCWSALGQYRVLVTPMHVALVTAAIANGGKLLSPSLELGRFPKSHGKVMNRKTAKVLGKMMRSVVDGGTGYRAEVPGLKIAGKTGTAENGNGVPHSWFASFAPYDNPKLVVVVLVENGGYGGKAAAEIARLMYRKAALLGYFTEEP